ncbi:MAG: arginine repressor [Clostridia bacterium]|nr:arginine repressor [Clostridia bacterium]
MNGNRREEILKIIAEEGIQTQEELAVKLAERGFSAGQATISRDIKALNLVKKMTPEGQLVYVPLLGEGKMMPEKLIPVFKNAFVSCDFAGNLVVIKTLSGMANALASAVDSMGFSGILGTIAGDDTVLVVCRTEGLASEVSEMLARQAG